MIVMIRIIRRLSLIGLMMRVPILVEYYNSRSCPPTAVSRKDGIICANLPYLLMSIPAALIARKFGYRRIAAGAVYL